MSRQHGVGNGALMYLIYAHAASGYLAATLCRAGSCCYCGHGSYCCSRWGRHVARMLQRIPLRLVVSTCVCRLRMLAASPLMASLDISRLFLSLLFFLSLVFSICCAQFFFGALQRRVAMHTTSTHTNLLIAQHDLHPQQRAAGPSAPPDFEKETQPHHLTVRLLVLGTCTGTTILLRLRATRVRHQQRLVAVVCEDGLDFTLLRLIDICL